MRTRAVHTIVATAVATIAVALPAVAGPERVDWPEDFANAYTLYLQVDRPDRKRVRMMYVNPEAPVGSEQQQPDAAGGQPWRVGAAAR
jgi:hypothetical protein